MWIYKAILESADLQATIVDLINKQDALMVVSDMYGDLNELLTTSSGPSESFKYFELRLSASVAKSNGKGESVRDTQSFTTLNLLSNENVESNQKISIRVAAATSDHGLNSQTITEDFIRLVKHESIDCFLRQCDYDSTPPLQPIDVLGSSSAISQKYAFRPNAVPIKPKSSI